MSEIIVLIFPISVKYNHIKRDLFSYLISCGLFIIFAYDGRISQFEGIVLVISLVFYIISLVILVPYFENTGLWLALLISFIVRGITLGIKYPNLQKSI